MYMYNFIKIFVRTMFLPWHMRLTWLAWTYVYIVEHDVDLILFPRSSLELEAVVVPLNGVPALLPVRGRQ